MQTFSQEEDHPLVLRDSLLSELEGSIGTRKYKSLYRLRNDIREDVINNGDLACAYFVSDLLWGFELISRGRHTTVQVTLEDMEASGWYKIDKPEAGAVVVWGEKWGDDGRPHRHLGICVDAEYAIEHSAVTKSPRKIDINALTMLDGSPRPPTAYYAHPKLRAA